MKTETINGKTYKVTESNTYYSEKTNDKVIDILERARYRGQRIKLFYGDVETGRNWNEESDTIGYIGRSTGTAKIPLLIHNKRSFGGGAILDKCIIKIVDVKTKDVLYVADNFQKTEFKIVPSDMDGYTHNVLINGSLYSRHKSERAAKLLVSKLS